MSNNFMYNGDLAISSNFDVNTAKPLDPRSCRNTIAELSDVNTWVKNGIRVEYEGLLVYVKEDSEFYKLVSVVGDVLTWKKIYTQSSPVVIAQTTGQSTTSVMSQKAITDALNLKINNSEVSAAGKSGSYNDLKDKPIIPSVDGLASETFVTESVEAATENLAPKSSIPTQLPTPFALTIGDVEFNGSSAKSVDIAAEVQREQAKDKGHFTLVGDLPTTGNLDGDYAFVGAALPWAIYDYKVDAWVDSGETFTPEIVLNDYVAKNELKQDLLSNSPTEVLSTEALIGGINIVKKGYVRSESGAEIPDEASTRRYTDYIRIVKGLSFKIKETATSIASVAFYDADKIFISALVQLNGVYVIEDLLVPDNAVYIRLTSLATASPYYAANLGALLDGLSGLKDMRLVTELGESTKVTLDQKTITKEFGESYDVNGVVSVSKSFEVSDGYIDLNGNLVASDIWQHTSNIDVEAGDLVIGDIETGSTISCIYDVTNKKVLQKGLYKSRYQFTEATTVTISGRLIVERLKFFNAPIAGGSVAPPPTPTETPTIITRLEKVGDYELSKTFPYQFLKSDGTLTQNVNTTYGTTSYIKIRGVQEIKTPALTGEACHLLLDSDKNIVKAITASDPTTNDVPDNVAYLRCSFYSSNKVSVLSINNNLVGDDFEHTSIGSDVLYRAGEAFDIVTPNAGFVDVNGVIQTAGSTSMHTDWMPVGVGVFTYSGTLGGSACICLFDKDKTLLRAITSSDDYSTITIQPKEVWMIISRPPYGGKTLTPQGLIVSPTITINNTIDAKDFGDSYSNGNLRDADFRFSLDYKFNRYLEVEEEIPLVDICGVRIAIKGQKNSMMTLPAPAGNPFDIKYPIPQRNVAYISRLVDGVNVYGTSPALSLPAYRELIGDDLFTIRYVGAARDKNIDDVDVQSAYATLSNNLTLSFVDGVLNVSTSSSTLINKTFALDSNIGDMITALRAEFTDFDFELFGSSFIKVGDIANIEQVCLVSQYLSKDVGKTDSRYEAYKAFFNHKIDNNIHNIEAVKKDDRLMIVTDGIVVFDTILSQGYTETISVSSDNVSILETIVNIGHTADAELTDNNIVSIKNPSVIALMGHGVYLGDECDGKRPIYEDMTPPSDDYAAVIPVKYAGVDYFGESKNEDGTYKTVLADIAMSTKRFERIVALAKSKGYVHIDMAKLSELNDGTLPKRCWSLCFDDRHTYFINDLHITQCFTKTNTPATWDVSFSRTSIEAYQKVIKQMKNVGWEVISHGVADINWHCSSAENLYNVVNRNGDIDTEWRQFAVQFEQCIEIGADPTTWVYSNGSSNPNVIKAFENQGVRSATMTDTLNQTCRAMNKYYIRRKNASEKTLFRTIEQMFI